MGKKGACAVKGIIRVAYVALVGLIVFTGALFIAQGLRAPQPQAQECPSPEPRLDTPELTL